MLLSRPPVVAAYVIMLALPVVVAAAVRRSDRGPRPDTGYPDPETGALFAVKNRRWQGVMFRVLGIAFLVIGGVFTLVSVAESDEMPGPGPLLGAIGISLFGALFVVIAIGVRRFGVYAFVDHIVVLPWFKKPRTVALSDIGSITRAQNRFGGIDVRDTAGKMLFTATTIHVGYTEILPYLEQHAPSPGANSSPPTADSLSGPTQVPITVDASIQGLDYGC